MSSDGNWLGDRSPLSDPGFICDSEGCWCLVDDGKHRMCFCGCHNRDIGGTVQRRKKWNGKEY